MPEVRSPALRSLTGIAGALTILLPAILSPAAASAQSTDVSDIVSRYGLRPIDPPTPAADFTLPNLAGGETSLSEYQGGWVVLTFWATWCGPCRSEMPSMEELHRKRAGSGLTVLGISIDQQRAPIDPYLKSIGVTFPNLWDEQGRAAQLYRASSIPLSYLVDPQGRLVAVSRGARNWAALMPMLDTLQGTAAGDGGENQYASDSAPVDLPPVLDPPTAEVALSQNSPRPGQPFFIDVHLKWAGNFEEYLPHPPQIFLPEGIVQEGMTATTNSRDGSNQVVYRVTLKAKAAGKYALDPVELRYTPRFESMPMASRITGPTVEVRPKTIAGLSPVAFAGSLGGLIGVGLLAFLWIRHGSRRAGAAAPAVNPQLDGLQKRLDEARALRLQGKPAAAFTALAELELELGVDDELARATRRMELEQARYGGRAPASEELDRLQRQLERRLAELRPSQEKARRQALRLRERET